MFTAALKEHKARATKARRELDARKRDVTVAVENLSAALTQQLTGSAALPPATTPAAAPAAGTAAAGSTGSSSASTSSGSGSGSGGVARLVWQQNALEAEAKTLQTQSARFARQTTKWLQLYKGLNDQLKELGDVRNWAQTVERDMLAVATALAHTVSVATRQPVVATAPPPQPQPQASAPQQPATAAAAAAMATAGAAADAKSAPAAAAVADDSKRRK